MKNCVYFLPRNTSYELPGETDNVCLLKEWDSTVYCLNCKEFIHSTQNLQYLSPWLKIQHCVHTIHEKIKYFQFYNIMGLKSHDSSIILWQLSTPPNSICTILLGCVVWCSESAFLHPHYDDGSWSILQFSIPTQVFPTFQCQGKNILYLKRSDI